MLPVPCYDENIDVLLNFVTSLVRPFLIPWSYIFLLYPLETRINVRNSPRSMESCSSAMKSISTAMNSKESTLLVDVSVV